MKDVFKVKGAFHLQIEEDGRIVGDSGWHENQVVNLGFNQYLVSLLGAIAGSKQITHAALGSGAAPASNATALAGELDHASNSRQAITAATSSTSKALSLTATFASTNSFVSNTFAISNIGLFNTSAVTVGTLFAGNTFTSSSLGTNQNCNITYVISFT